jgi:preprotein translocase subunit Sss1
MRMGSVFAMALALAFCAALCGIFVWLVGRVGFVAAVVAGLAVLFVAYMVELEDGAAIGGSSTPGLFASQQQDEAGGPEDRAARRADRARTRDAIAIAKHVGAALLTVGTLGFIFLQM